MKQTRPFALQDVKGVLLVEVGWRRVFCMTREYFGDQPGYGTFASTLRPVEYGHDAGFLSTLVHPGDPGNQVHCRFARDILEDDPPVVDEAVGSVWYELACVV